MNIGNIARGLQKVVRFIYKHRTTIMVGAGIASTAAGVYLSVESTKELDGEFKEFEAAKERGEETDTKELVVTVAKSVWKPAACFVVGAGLIIFAHKIDQKTIRGLAAEVASLYASDAWNREKYRRKYGAKALREFEEWDGKNEKEVITEEEKQQRELREAKVMPYLPPHFVNGLYFAHSDAYDSSDNYVNTATIQQMDEKVVNIIRHSMSGKASFREVLETFQFYKTIEQVEESIALGELPESYLEDKGWTLDTWWGVDIERDAVDVEHTSGILREEIYIRWPNQPKLFAALDYVGKRGLQY